MLFSAFWSTTGNILSQNESQININIRSVKTSCTVLTDIDKINTLS